MARGSRYCLPLRRRKEGKTNYRTRKVFILSGRPRVVVRSSLKNVTAQIIVAKPRGDEVLSSAHSRELFKKYGWKASSGNISAAYLTGLLCGLKAKAKGITEVIADIGLHSPTKGAKIFAVLKGIVDGGIEIPLSEEKLPDEKRIKGEHVVKYAQSFASTPDLYQSRFSQYIQRKNPPENLDKHFEEVKKEMIAVFQRGGKTS